MFNFLREKIVKSESLREKICKRIKNTCSVVHTPITNELYDAMEMYPVFSDVHYNIRINGVHLVVGRPNRQRLINFLIYNKKEQTLFIFSALLILKKSST